MKFKETKSDQLATNERRATMTQPLHAQGQWRSIAPKIRIVKNVVVLGCSFLCAYGIGFTPLRTYLALSEDLKILGPFVLLLLYICAALSCIYGPCASKKYRYKYVIALCWLPFGLLIGASAYTHYYTIIPAAMAIGLAQGPLWSAATAYLINMAAEYAYFTHKPQPDGMVLRMFTILNTLSSVGNFIGHLQAAGAFSAMEYAQNKTNVPWQLYSHQECGKRFYNPDSLKKLPEFDKPQAYNFTAILSRFSVTAEMSHIVPLYSLALSTGFTICGVFLALFPLGKQSVQLCIESQKTTSVSQSVVEMVKVLQDRRMLFTIPLIIFHGFSEAFLACDIMKAFVACMTPKAAVGYVLFAAGCCAAFFHSFLSSAVRQLDRFIILLGGSAVQLGAIVIMWMWKPVSDDKPMLYVIATSWIMADTISLLFRAFPNHWEAPFAAYFMAFFLGQALGFGVCPISCLEYKLYFALLFFSTAIIPYGVLEWMLQKDQLSQWK